MISLGISNLLLFGPLDSIQHVPSGFLMSSFIPLLALLLHHIEPLTPSIPASTVAQRQHGATLQEQELGTVEINPTLKRLFTELLIVTEKGHRYITIVIGVNYTSYWALLATYPQYV